MASHLQDLVEGLANRLGRSVAIDDARLHLLAHSRHFGEVDPARAESILRRAVPREIVDHVYACRDDATGRYLVSPRDDLGLHDTRIGSPILHHGSVLGFVWLLGGEGPIDDEHLGAVDRLAAEAAVLIHREHLHAGSARAREQALVQKLFGGDESERRAAALELRADLFPTSAYAVIVAEIDRPGARVTDEDQLALASGLAAVRRRRVPHDVLALERRSAVVLVVAEPVGASDEGMLTLGRALRDAVLAGADGAECWVGVSRARSDLAEARRSADEAESAVRIGRRVPGLAPVSAVASLGAYEALDRVPDDVLRAVVPSGLRTLIAQSAKNDALVRTLETFLDNAGDVKAASEQLFAHRTSLYYRLRRIQELTGLDLSTGDDRLIAHLAVKISHLVDLSE